MRFRPFGSSIPKPMTEEEKFRRYGQTLTVSLVGEWSLLSRSEALERLTQRMIEVSPAELARLDRQSRQFSPYRNLDTPTWMVIQPDEVERILDAPYSAIGLLGVVSFHANGFVREKALARLAALRSGSELPFLLLRLNDWVQPIHEAAVGALRTRLTPDYAAAFVRCLPILFELEGPRRRDSGPWLQAVSDLLKQPECELALWDGLGMGEKSVRRLCFRLLAESFHVSLERAVQEALADPDPGLRRTAAVCARERLDAEQFQTLLPRLGRDAAPSVRREGLQGVVERLPETAEVQLRAALLDGRSSLREIAQYYLKRRHGVDTAAFYRATLVAGGASTLLAAIGGLGETGTMADVALVLPYLSHPLTKARKAAVRALGCLGGDAHVASLLAALRDVSPSVTREACAALRLRMASVDPEALWQVFVSQEPPHVRLALLSLLAQVGRWESIPYLVRASADGDVVVRDKAGEQMEAWVNGGMASFMKPTPKQIARLREALVESPNAKLKAVVVDWERKQRVDA